MAFAQSLQVKKKPVKCPFMLNLSTINLKDLVKDYGPLFTAGATIVAATVASFAARAAMRSARASERNVKTGITAMEIANRPYIVMISGHFTETLQTNKKPHVRAIFKNVGKTPALNMTVTSKLYVSFDPNKTLPLSPEPSGLVSCGPNQDLSLLSDAESPLTEEEIIALQNKDKFLICWGQITYEDIFHERHKTSWRLKYSSTAPSGLTIHSTGNDMT